MVFYKFWSYICTARYLMLLPRIFNTILQSHNFFATCGVTEIYNGIRSVMPPLMTLWNLSFEFICLLFHYSFNNVSQLPLQVFIIDFYNSTNFIASAKIISMSDLLDSSTSTVSREK